MQKTISPPVISPLEEQLLNLRTRRSVVDRLIRSLELYHRITPSGALHRRDRVA
jgi:hypothetical protein